MDSRLRIRTRYTGGVLAVLAVLAMLAVGPALADQWYAEPKARLYGFYEDNVGLVTTNEKSSPGFIASASVKGGTRSETRDINLAGELVRRQYFDDSPRNTTDFHFDGGYVRKIERDRFVLDAAYDLDSSLTSEVGTSGRVQVNKRRNRWSLAPGWQRQVDERLSLNAALSYADVRYDDGLSAGLVDYSYATLGGGFAYGVSERMQVIGRLSYDRYDAEQITNTSDTFGLLAGVGYAFSEDWSVNALIGARVAEVETSLGSNDSTGGLFDISTTKRIETGSLRAAIGRDLQPSGDGVLLDTLRASVDWDQAITPRWRGLLHIDAYRNTLPSGTASGLDRDYFSIAPRLRYQIERDWALDLGYRYRYQKYDNATASAEANAVFFTIAYAPQRERPDLDLTR